MMYRMIKWLAWIFLTAVFSFYLGLATLIYGEVIYPFLQQDFDSQTWVDATENERGYMLENLLQKHEGFDGMTVIEVINLLGVPDRQRENLSSISYAIGPLEGKYGFMAFPYTLYIGFDGGLVDGYSIGD